MLKSITIATVTLLAGTLIISYAAAPVSNSSRAASPLVSSAGTTYHEGKNANLRSLPVHAIEDYSLVYPVAANQKWQ